MSVLNADYLSPKEAEWGEKSFFYCRTPMLLIDSTGIVREINAACRHLFGTDVAGCVGRPYVYLVERLERNTEGEVIPPAGIARKYLGEPTSVAHTPRGIALKTADIQVLMSDCLYRSKWFG